MFIQPKLAPISRMLADTGVTDLVINGCDSAAVLVGGSWKQVASGFESECEVADAARELIELGGRQIDMARPFGNVELLGKLRVHAMLASAVNSKTHISIRVHAPRAVALEQLMRIQMITAEQLTLLRHILQSRQTFIISGSAGAGKTTLLRSMLLEVASERIISIEDVAELCIDSATSVSLISREPNIEARGEISLEDLLAESLRMRPDRIVVGEIRSRELFVLLQAVSSGHCAAATIHANSIDQVMDRLVAIGLANSIDAASSKSLFESTVNWLIHISAESGKRRVEIRRAHE